MKRFISFFLGLMMVTTISYASVVEAGLSIGLKAPEIIAKTHTGEEFVLSDKYTKKPVVLILYRGGWCPFCNIHLQSFEKIKEEFDSLGVSIVAASIDTVEKAAEISDGTSYGIELGQQSGKQVDNISVSFDVVAELDVETLGKYNAVFKVDDNMVVKYAEYGIDLEGASGKDHHIIAIPATYVIDTDGIIVFAESDIDYKIRTSPEKVLDFLKNR